MRKNLWLAVAVLVLGGSGEPIHGEGQLNDFVVVLPQVAKGDLIETTIVFLNTSTTAVDVAVEATDEQLLEPTSFELGPFERRDLKLDAEGELVKGAVRVQAESTISVEGRIRTRSEPGGDFTSHVTILAEPLQSEVVIPISYRSDGIDNTGIALFFEEAGFLEISVYDSVGNLVDEGAEMMGGMGHPDRHAAFFFDEWFAPLLGDRDEFTGSLRLGFTTGMGFAATALYTKGLEYWTARVQEVNEARRYFDVYMTPGVAVDALDGMSVEYGFQVHEESESHATVYCTGQVARAVERDPRVSKVIAAGPSGVH
ncbi:MAG: hypothetical protein P8Z74_19595 [Acidobacteriota bacterium]